MSSTTTPVLNTAQMNQLDNFAGRMENAITFNLVLESIKVEKGTQLSAAKAQTQPV